MNPLEQYGIKTGGVVEIRSPICSAAVSLANSQSYGKLQGTITELTSSYFNQWRFVLDAYEKLYALFFDLNQADDNSTESRIFTEFDIKSIEKEIEFKNYSYLFIISLKSLLDLFTCLVDIVQNQIPREKYYPDFFGYCEKSKPEHPIKEIKKEFKRLRRKNNTNWIFDLTIIRNKIIHGGYLLRPIVGSKKTKNLIMQTYKGTNFYIGIDTIDIGNLFENFILQMPKIEQTVTNILIKNIDPLTNGLTHECSFKYHDLINEYHVKEYEH